MVIAAVCLALCYVLPFLTGQIQGIGKMLCPMHLPVFICGFVCGRWWGLAVGLVAPLLRSVTLGMPPMFPDAVSMAVELAVYGFVSAVIYDALPKKLPYIYIARFGNALRQGSLGSDEIRYCRHFKNEIHFSDVSGGSVYACFSRNNRSTFTCAGGD